MAPLENQTNSTRQTANFMHPERIIADLGLSRSMTIADFGAGAGYFTLPMARIAGQEGKVYALDIQKEALSLIRARAKIEHLLNIETVRADLELPRGSKLKDESADFVLISNILFQAEKKNEIIAESFRVLKPGGRLAIFEWDQSASTGGPPMRLRIPPNTAKTFAQNAGFALDREFSAGSHHYGFIFRKP